MAGRQVSILNGNGTGYENTTFYTGRSAQGKRVEQFLSVPSDVICGLCNGVMRDPIKAIDGASYCRLCYIGKKEYTNNEMLPRFEKDDELEERITALYCYCDNRRFGCDWKGQYGQLDEHLSECQYLPIQCPHCFAVFSKYEEGAHSESCTHEVCICGQICHKSVILQHRRGCDSYFSCASCAISIKRKHFGDHVKSCDTIYCKVCKKQVHQTEMFSHIQERMMVANESGIRHIISMIDEIKLTGNTLKLCQLDNKLLNEEVRSLKQQFEKHTEIGSGRKDGTIIWVVKDVLNKLEIEKRDSQPLFSPHFYSCDNGYEMGAKLYLNGDSDAIGEYISLYFLIYQGPYDEILSWPFTPRVSLQILGKNKSTLTKVFTPEGSSLSFLKPQTASNMPSGYKKFALQQILKQDDFVRGGSLFIKVVTDIADARHP